ncbi:hypothetical protein PR048_009384 [Dryococelus australis]|uniref:Uncharacterized protein n=1 Tax=Dryococelus australis TaxID=614101 RepID=A0ABQ9HZU7_9NEOP|nr:hypothetical protein PR048_009384 [Dryococelus australis]
MQTRLPDVVTLLCCQAKGQLAIVLIMTVVVFWLTLINVVDKTLDKHCSRQTWGNVTPAIQLDLNLLAIIFAEEHENRATAIKFEIHEKMARSWGGLTSVMQPLGICINKPFRDHIHWLYEWLTGDKHNLTPTGKLKRPSLQLICMWILRSWDLIPLEMVSHSFKKTRILNALDSSEDDAL